MKKTYVTSMPNNIGAFMKASECFAKLGINITRVSYNKAVDSHTLFIDADGTEQQLKQADIYINTNGLTHRQAEYNQYAPILMTSVDTNPTLCAEERKAVMQRLGVGEWQIFGAHGYKKIIM